MEFESEVKKLVWMTDNTYDFTQRIDLSGTDS